MSKLLRASAILVGWLVLGSSSVMAQNTTCATRPYGDNSNACASTAFVQTAIAGIVNIPNHSVALGTGSNTLNSTGPAAAGAAFLANGVSADPSWTLTPTWTGLHTYSGSSGGINVTASPYYSSTATGQAFATLSSLSVQSSTIAGATGEHLVKIGLVSGAGSGGNVALFASATATGAFDTWAQNLLGTINPSAGSQNYLLSEFDLNNFNADRGNTAGPNGLGGPVSYGLQFSGVSTKKNTAAIIVTGSAGQWNRGIAFGGGGATVMCSICEYGAPAATIDVWGYPTNIIDATNVSGGTPTNILKAPSINIAWNGVITLASWGGQIVDVTHGGTGNNTATLNGVLYGNTTAALQATAQGAANTVLVANAGAPSFSTNPTISTLLLAGATSGTITLKPAATAGSNAITFPAGTTDFSGTGGTSQVVKQVSVGAAFTVARLACADLSDAAATCSSGSGGSLVVGTTTISSGTTARILYDNGGTLGEYTLTGSGTVVAMGTSPSFTTDITTPIAKLSGASNQLVFQSAGVTGTLSWTPATTNKTITLPNGTTDFTGTSGIVQQASAGAAFTVGTVALASLATQATNTIVGNATAGTAAPTALAVGTCSTSSSALIWTTNSGFGCNTSINAATLGAKSIGTTGNTVPLLDGTNTASGVNTFSNNTDATDTTHAGVVMSGGLAVAKKIRAGDGFFPGPGSFAANTPQIYTASTYGLVLTAGASASGYDIGMFGRAGAELFVNVAASADIRIVGDSGANQGHIRTGASPPALTSCGTGSPAIVGSDTAGQVTMGTSATGCVLTFNVAHTNTPYCVVTWQNTPLASQSYTVSNTAITLTQTSTSGNKANYHCIAQSAG